MKKLVILVLFIFFFSSCQQNKKEITFELMNKSDFPIDSLEIALSDSSTDWNKKIQPNESITLEMLYIIPEDFNGANVFIIYYYRNGEEYNTDFGYSATPAFLDEKYNLYFFNEGVSEINRKPTHLKENKHEIE